MVLYGEGLNMGDKIPTPFDFYREWYKNKGTIKFTKHGFVLIYEKNRL